MTQTPIDEWPVVMAPPGTVVYRYRVHPSLVAQPQQWRLMYAQAIDRLGFDPVTPPGPLTTGEEHTWWAIGVVRPRP